MALVYVSVGSNINRYQHISACLDALSDRFGELDISPVYESKSVGFKGSDFLNLVVGFHSPLSVAQLAVALRQIEHDNGRRRGGAKFSSRTLDIDILTYDDFVGEYAGVTLPRDEISKNAFVLLPLADIAPNVQHPTLATSYSQLWASYNKESQPLWPVEFLWRGNNLSLRNT